MKCNVGLECKLECQSWEQEKNNLTPINERQEMKSWNRINETKLETSTKKLAKPKQNHKTFEWKNLLWFLKMTPHAPSFGTCAS
jgi:hypothetical protein